MIVPVKFRRRSVIFSQNWRVSLLISGIIFLFLVFPPAIIKPWIDDLERYSHDKRFELRGPEKTDPDIIIVGIDEEGVESEGRPLPFWNPVYAEFLQGMANASAAHVFIDIIYNSLTDSAIREMVKAQLAKHGRELPRQVLSQMGFDIPLIQMLAELKKTGLKTVLGFFSDKMIFRFTPFAFQPTAYGFVNLESQPDYVCRKAVVYGQSLANKEFLPSVALALAGIKLNSPWSIASDSTLRIGEHRIVSLGNDREGWINFHGPKGTFPMVPIGRVLEDIRTKSENLSIFKDKTVLVGLWTFADRKTIPFGVVQGVEIHANILDNLLHDRFLRPLGNNLSIVILALAVLLTFLGFLNDFKIGLGFSIGLLAGHCFATIYFFREGILYPFSLTFLYLILFPSIETFRVLYGKDRERKMVKSMFRRYVNDSVIASIMNEPWEKLLEGKRGQICVMIVDIRGFTSFSEPQDPQTVVNFLNNYFSKITACILQHNGVVDKFLGDGLLAFFNAPVPQPDYLRHAVLAAKEIRELAKSLEIRNENVAFVPKVGIALHAGEAIVGNIGSEMKMEFTAIGDTVNATSRIESLNKEFGTDIIATETVVSGTKDEFLWISLGERKLRGKEKSVKLFTLNPPQKEEN